MKVLVRMSYTRGNYNNIVAMKKFLDRGEQEYTAEIVEHDQWSEVVFSVPEGTDHNALRRAYEEFWETV